jgi:hypothetical protein
MTTSRRVPGAVPADEFIRRGSRRPRSRGEPARLGYVRVDEVSVGGDRATATDHGRGEGSFEYQVFGRSRSRTASGSWQRLRHVRLPGVQPAVAPTIQSQRKDRYSIRRGPDPDGSA